jgi:hypothetical protein
MIELARNRPPGAIGTIKDKLECMSLAKYKIPFGLNLNFDFKT